MHDGLVHSCNAYFAQLAVDIGPAALADTAGRFGIAVAPPNSPDRLRGSLPQAGYGQGDVLATPLEMARVAALFAGGGILRDTNWLESEPSDDGGQGRCLPAAEKLPI